MIIRYFLGLLLEGLLSIIRNYRRSNIYRWIMGDKAKPHMTDLDYGLARQEKTAARQLRALQASKGRYCGQFHTEISIQEFRKRFHKNIAREAPGYYGKIETNHVFTFWYAAEPAYGIFLKRLLGHITPAGEVTYRITGTQLYERQEIARERLENKLRELCE